MFKKSLIFSVFLIAVALVLPAVSWAAIQAPQYQCLGSSQNVLSGPFSSLSACTAVCPPPGLIGKCALKPVAGNPPADVRMESPTIINDGIMNVRRELETNDYSAWRRAPRLAAGATGDTVASLAKTLGTFGFMDNAIASNARTIGPVTTNSIKNIQSFFRVSGAEAGVFDQKTSSALSQFVDTFIIAANTLPADANNVLAEFPSGNIARFDRATGVFSFDFTNNEPSPSNWPFWPFRRCQPSIVQGLPGFHCSWSF